MHQPEFKLIGIILSAGIGLVTWIAAFVLLAWLFQLPQCNFDQFFAGGTAPTSADGSI